MPEPVPTRRAIRPGDGCGPSVVSGGTSWWATPLSCFVAVLVIVGITALLATNVSTMRGLGDYAGDGRQSPSCVSVLRGRRTG